MQELSEQNSKCIRNNSKNQQGELYQIYKVPTQQMEQKAELRDNLWKEKKFYQLYLRQIINM